MQWHRMHITERGALQVLCALCALLSLAEAGLAQHADGGGGLTAEVYANSVMRGTPVCKAVLANGFRKDTASLCGAAGAGKLKPGEYSIRLTGTLSAPGPRQWHRFSATVGQTALVRLWVDDHRLVDAWSPRTPGDTDTPATPGLLPNVTMDSGRAVFDWVRGFVRRTGFPKVPVGTAYRI